MIEMMILRNSVMALKDRFTLAALNVGRSFQSVLKEVLRSWECKTFSPILLLFLGGFSIASAAEDIEFFESKIRPVLAENCYECHSAEAANKGKLKGGLLLDTRDAIRKGGDSGPAVVPGNVAESLLLKALRQEDIEMPPKGKLPDTIIADFTKWIESGAADPRDKPSVVLQDNTIDASDHWAFTKPEKSEIPGVKNTAWPQSDIDRFVLHQLEEKKLQPVSTAAPQVLVRRIYFDLLGLPPTPEQVKAFEVAAEKDRHAAIQALVDSLLKSPHYGERWGRHWLDVARYAEDQAHTFGVKRRDQAHQYRDWVIQMFNKDLPFDQFIKLQLAGDLMEEKSDDLFQQLAGLGFLGLGAQYYKNSDKAQAEADELDDTIDTLTRGFLGLTVSCARCHDHKYDPIPTEDYYALAGIFSGRRYSELPLVGQDQVKAYSEEQQKIKDLDNLHRNFLRGIGRGVGLQQLEKLSQYLQEGWRMTTLNAQGDKINHEQFAEKVALHPHFVRRFREMLDERRKADLIKLFPELEGWHNIMVEFEEKPSIETIRVPQQITQLAEKLQSAVLEAKNAFDQMAVENAEELAKARSVEERHNKIVNKLEKEHKRLMQNVFFAGNALFLSNEKDTEKYFLTDDQQKQADQYKTEADELRKTAQPKYPVAHAISGGGRAMQVYIRGNPANKGNWVARGTLAMLSDQPRPIDPNEAKKFAYSRMDLANAIASPDNPLTARVIVNRVWQWHFGKGLVKSSSNFGLLGEAPTHPELLDWLTVGFIENGWSIKWLHRQILSSATYQLSSESLPANEEIDADNLYRWRFDRRRLEVEAWRDALLAVSGKLDPTMGGPTLDLNNNNVRRTVYAKISRHELDGMLRLFDFPDANVSSAARTKTTVPQQQLFVLNSNFFIEQAKSFAKRLMDSSEDVAKQIDVAYHLAFGRPPSEPELQLAKAYLSEEKAKEDKLSRWEQYCQAILASNELMYID
jgi:hypothetical protein